MTKPIDVYEARDLMHRGPYWEDCLEWLFGEIRRCASQGGEELVFLVPPNYPTSTVESELQCKGFTVKTEGSCTNPATGSTARMRIRWGY